MDWNNINRDRDTSGLGPIEYDQTKVPALIRKHADNVRTKTYGQEVREAQARNAEVAGLIASEAEIKADNADLLSKDTKNRFNDQIAGTTNSDEVIDARRPFGSETAFQTLGDRLDTQYNDVSNRTEYIINPKNYGSLEEAIDATKAVQGAVLTTGYLKLESDTDFRGVKLNIGYLDKGGYTVTFGAFTHDSATRVPQRVDRISNQTHRETGKVFFKGASYASYNIGTYNGCVHFWLSDDMVDDVLTATYIAYANFTFDNVPDIDIKNDPNNDATIIGDKRLWFNENTFYLKNTYSFKMDGTYNHNNNVINGGCFEGNSDITLNIGSNNIFRDIRAESPDGGKQVRISFGKKANFNKVYISSAIFSPTVTDLGVGNTVIRERLRNIRQVNQFHKSKYDIVTINDTNRLILDKGFKNLQFNSNGLLTVSPYGSKLKTVIFESPLYDNPQNMACLLEVSLGTGLGYSINYRLYDSNRSDVTSDLYAQHGAFFGITTAASVIESGNEEISLNPSYVDANVRFTPSNGIKNDKVFLQPLNYRFNNMNEVAFPKFVKFEIVSDEAVSFSGATVTNAHDLTVSVFDMSNNYHYRYFNN